MLALVLVLSQSSIFAEGAPRHPDDDRVLFAAALKKS
jgi:hypothetical protein